VKKYFVCKPNIPFLWKCDGEKLQAFLPWSPKKEFFPTLITTFFFISHHDREEEYMHLIYFLIIGLAAGWLAGQIMKGKGFGLLGNLLLGCIGAFVGGFVFDVLGIYTRGTIGSIIAALAGALLLLWGINLLKKK
jgi:uncharacterized membrane protein YeaQ/YmgE (transglycosylase-associated protein family)